MRTTAEMSPMSSPAKPTASLRPGSALPSWPGSMIQSFPASTSSALISLSFIGSPTLRDPAGRRTVGRNRTLAALRFPGRADAASVPDHPMGEIDPLFLRQKAHQVPLDFLRIHFARQLKSARDPLNVGVDDDARRLLEPGAEHDIGGLPRDARQFEERLHRVGHFPAVLFDEELRGAPDALRLVVVEARRTNPLLQVLQVGVGIILCRPVLLEGPGAADSFDGLLPQQ